jgi:TIR domain
LVTMADIFVSYSKIDHALASNLSAFLQAEGWSVWWDKSLGAADLYRDEIIKQLVAARAVITIWTPNSIKSDWVRAEAGAAKKDGKLIPVKTPEVGYADIPLPFGEMHTENVGSTDLIRAAVIAQLAKPAVEPTAWALLSKGLKLELLTWWGIIGGAITLFIAVSTTLKLADWDRVLVEHWKEWTHKFWVWVFDWTGIHLTPDWSFVLSFLLFGSLLAIGEAARFMPAFTVRSTPYNGWSFHFVSRRTLFCFVSILAVYLIFSILMAFFGNARPVFMLLGGLIIIVPQVIIVLFARHRLHAGIAVFLLFIFAGTLVIVPGSDNPDAKVAVGFWLTACVLPLILLSVAPAKAVSRRLIFLALGLLLLIALNELSKLGLDVTAPKLQG